VDEFQAVRRREWWVNGGRKRMCWTGGIGRTALKDYVIDRGTY